MNRDAFPYKILIIEDNMGDFILIQDYLHEMIREPHITHCQTFKQANSTLQNTEEKFDLILLDLYLPDKSGKPLIDSVLSLSKESLVIILSGNSDLAFSVQSIALGVDDYLIKDDLNGNSLYKSIIYCLERRKKTQELLDSEQRYNELFDFSPQPMWVFDLETLEFMDVNLAAIKHYGYERSEFLSMKITEIRPPDEIPALLEDVQESRSVNPYNAIGIFKHLKKNGELILVEIRANPLIFKGRKARVVLANDITERVKYVKSIELQNENLSHIAWIQSHLVRAPLARIMGIINHFEYNKNLTDSEKEHFFEHILSSAYELDGLITEISNKAYLAKTNIDMEQHR